MQAADARQRDDLRRGRGARCHRTRVRGILLEPEVGSVLVVKREELCHQAAQMAGVEHDHVIEQLASCGSDRAFADPVLPGTLKPGAFDLDAERFGGLLDLGAEDRIVVAEDR